MTQSLSLTTPLQFLKGVGPKAAGKLSKIGLNTVKDFLHYFPRAYEDRRKTINGKDFIRNIDQEVMTIGTVKTIKESGHKMSVLKVTMGTIDNMSFQAIWFNQKFMKRNLTASKTFFLKGKLTFDAYNRVFQIQVSDYDLIKSTEDLQKVVPIYNLTTGVYQKTLRNIALQIFETITIKEYLPTSLTESLSLTSLNSSLKEMHLPQGDRHRWKKARNRVVFDELFQIQLKAAQHYYQLHRLRKGFIFEENPQLLSKYLKNLPYTLTEAQQRTVEEIATDVSAGKCMNRILQGEVGSGKTEVATAAAILAISSGFQVALMVPTEVLAQQHFKKISEKLGEIGIGVCSLLGKHTANEKDEIYKEIATGTAQIVIGTHAIFQDKVVFQNLGLLIVDEQHRFGVIQREKLIAKGNNPHILVMTATPIPRSLSLTIYGDLDRSILNEMPPGRKPIKTRWYKEKELPKVKGFVRSIVDKGQQVYIVYPLIEESEKIDLKDALNGYDNWSKEFDSVGLLHGKMDQNQKEETISKFYRGEIKILVSTTVIEVGIDVANATTMIIENAHRFGLAQLHQLRGRVGRGKDKSYCFLISNSSSSNSKKRLKSLENISDGFKLAEIDLAMRGAGDYMGTRQSGMPSLNLTDLIKDNDILQSARKAAFEIIHDDPKLEKTSHKILREITASQLGSRLN